MTAASLPPPFWPSPDRDQIGIFLNLLGKDPASAKVRAFLPMAQHAMAEDPGRKGPLEIQQLQQWQ